MLSSTVLNRGGFGSSTIVRQIHCEVSAETEPSRRLCVARLIGAPFAQVEALLATCSMLRRRTEASECAITSTYPPIHIDTCCSNSPVYACGLKAPSAAAVVCRHRHKRQVSTCLVWSSKLAAVVSFDESNRFQGFGVGFSALALEKGNCSELNVWTIS